VFIRYNGPDLAHADAVIREALDLHFDVAGGGKWHFEHVTAGAQGTVCLAL
jgi:hypothetical protein